MGRGLALGNRAIVASGATADADQGVIHLGTTKAGEIRTGTIMTRLARSSGRDVIAGLSGREAIVVASRTGGRDVLCLMVHDATGERSHRHRHASAMAHATFQRGRDMLGGRLANRTLVVMAIGASELTGTWHGDAGTRMIKVAGLPGKGAVVAGVATGTAGRIDVTWRLTGGGNTMTGGAAMVPNMDPLAGVVETSRYPGDGLVTNVAGLGGKNMIHRLAGGTHAIMTSGTATGNNALVIEAGGAPGGGVLVADITSLGGRNMVHRLASSHPAIMAVGATARSHAGVIESRHQPVVGVVAIAASKRGRNMVGWLGNAVRKKTGVMATRAVTWRALEDAAYVTLLALDLVMQAS